LLKKELSAIFLASIFGKESANSAQVLFAPSLPNGLVIISQFYIPLIALLRFLYLYIYLVISYFHPKNSYSYGDLRQCVVWQLTSLFKRAADHCIFDF
jgi:hypothetical protein